MLLLLPSGNGVRQGHILDRHYVGLRSPQSAEIRRNNSSGVLSDYLPRALPVMGLRCRVDGLSKCCFLVIYAKEIMVLSALVGIFHLFVKTAQRLSQNLVDEGGTRTTEETIRFW